MNTLKQLQNRLLDYAEFHPGRGIDVKLIEKADLTATLKLYRIHLQDDALTAQAERELIREAKETLKKLQPKNVGDGVEH